MGSRRNRKPQVTKPAEPPDDQKIQILTAEVKRLTLLAELLKLQAKSSELDRQLDAATTERDAHLHGWAFDGNQWYPDNRAE